MSNQYTIAYDKSIKRLDALLDDPGIFDALNKRLPNNEDATDEEKWAKDVALFMQNNKEQLSEWLKLLSP